MHQSPSKRNKIILIFRNTRTDQVEELSAAFVCGCDGARSRIRQLLRIPFVGNWYKPTFIMGDYLDRSNLGDQALLWFTDHGTVEIVSVARAMPKMDYSNTLLYETGPERIFRTRTL